MRSLEEWTKYLEQQELALEQTTQPRAEPEQPRVRERTVKPSVAPRTEEVSASFEYVESVEKAVSTEENPVLTAASAQPTVIEPMQASAADDAALVKSAARLRKKAPGSLLSVQEKTQDEVAQNSYSVFKETREELLQRLLDPQLSLEDTARILNVCPTTVRRYTNRGLLKHVRTAGNQRRFRLSDVLSFMETHMGGVPEIGN